MGEMARSSKGKRKDSRWSATGSSVPASAFKVAWWSWTDTTKHALMIELNDVTRGQDVDWLMLVPS